MTDEDDELRMAIERIERRLDAQDVQIDRLSATLEKIAIALGISPHG